MSLFGSQNDFKLIRKMNRALLRDIIQQEAVYYKISLEDTQSNIYGESLHKTFLPPVLINCLLTTSDQTATVDEFGPDTQRALSFAFLRDDLVDASLVPEIGDIIMVYENYYEVDLVKENQYFFGKDDSYNYGRGEKHGESISIICETHLTRADKLGILQVR